MPAAVVYFSMSFEILKSMVFERNAVQSCNLKLSRTFKNEKFNSFWS